MSGPPNNPPRPGASGRDGDGASGADEEDATLYRLGDPDRDDDAPTKGIVVDAGEATLFRPVRASSAPSAGPPDLSATLKRDLAPRGAFAQRTPEVAGPSTRLDPSLFVPTLVRGPEQASATPMFGTEVVSRGAPDTPTNPDIVPPVT